MVFVFVLNCFVPFLKFGSCPLKIPDASLSISFEELSSNNVDEVIRAISNLFFFYKKIPQAQKAQNAHKRTKTKKQRFNAIKKHLRARNSLIRLFTVLIRLSFSIITIFFNYHNLFITIFFITIFFNLLTACDTIFIKISQRINSII